MGRLIVSAQMTMDSVMDQLEGWFNPETRLRTTRSRGASRAADALILGRETYEGMLCTFLYTAELMAANPMPMVGWPKLAKTLPKALPADAVAALLGAVDADPRPRRRTDWMQRDRALILTALLAGLRADELVRANVGDVRRTDDGAVIHVHGKGGKDRRIPIEAVLAEVIERYLASRVARFPAAAKRRSSPGGGTGRLAGGGAAVCGRRR